MRIVDYTQEACIIPPEIAGLASSGVAVSAPATLANIGPGFDMLGAALHGPSDIVIARKTASGIRCSAIFNGDNLPPSPEDNLVVKAARCVIESFGLDFGVDLILHKGVPVGRGMGSSSASIVAAAYAVALLDSDSVDEMKLIKAVQFCEPGGHLDNIAPCLMGGFVQIKSYDPVQIERLGAVDDLTVVEASPDFIVETKAAREGIPAKEVVAEKNKKYFDGMMDGIRQNDAKKVGANAVDLVVEPLRKRLIKGFDDVKAAAMDNGACGCSISGSGPTMFALTDDPAMAMRIARAMGEAFVANGTGCVVYISKINENGASRIQ